MQHGTSGEILGNNFCSDGPSTRTTRSANSISQVSMFRMWLRFRLTERHPQLHDGRLFLHRCGPLEPHPGHRYQQGSLVNAS